MKKLILINLFLLLFKTSVESFLEHWEWLSPLPQGTSYTGVFTIDDNHAVIVGHAGVIIKTEDGGLNWKEVNSKVHNNLRDVFFADENNGWAIGDSGIVIKTVDGGESWVLLNSGIKHHLKRVQFISSAIGWIVGEKGTILKTIDGGTTWIKQISGTSETLTDVHFVNPLYGWISGEGWVLLYTVNGGDTWNDKNYNEDLDYRSVFFLNSDTGWISADSGLIYMTEDSGTTWEEKFKFEVSMEPITSILFIDKYNGIACNHTRGTIFTTSGGKYWAEDTFKVTVDIRSVYFTPLKTGWAVGDYGRIIKSPDFGKTWDSINTGTHKELLSVFFVDSLTGWVVGQGTIIKTIDGGKTWVSQNDYYPIGYLMMVFFIDANTGWIAGGHERLFKTTDGGENWVSCSSNISQAVGYIHFFNEDKGYAASSNTFFSTVDGGLTWTERIIDTCIRINSMHFIDENIGFFTGRVDTSGILEDVVFKTTDGGATWKQIPIVTGSFLNIEQIYFSSHKAGWIGGMWGTILHSNDTGETWDSIGQVNGRAQSFYFHNDSVGWVVGKDRGNGGYAGLISKTLDGGVTWHSRQVAANLNDVHFVDENNGWVVGWGGSILRTTDGGGPVPINNNPNKYLKKNNFNIKQHKRGEYLIICFSLQSPSPITLNMFDLKGRKIKSIRYKFHDQGQKEINLNISDISSGIYLLQLNSNNNSITKKIIKPF